MFSKFHSRAFLTCHPASQSYIGQEPTLGLMWEESILPLWMTELSPVKATYLVPNQCLSSEKAVLVVTVGT